MESTEILLTVAIPTYNRAANLEFALSRLLKQRNERIEFLISDNCSSDNTCEVVKKYQNEYSDLRYRRNDENVGAARNYIECYNNAKGKFVYLLADDDVLLDGALEQITSFLDAHSDISILYLNHVFFRDVYEGEEKCTAPYINISEDIVTLNKTEFMKYAGMRITFTPSIVISREDYLLIDNPEQYEYTRFLQTCVAFMCTKGNKKMGKFITRNKNASAEKFFPSAVMSKSTA